MGALTCVSHKTPSPCVRASPLWVMKVCILHAIECDRVDGGPVGGGSVSVLVLVFAPIDALLLLLLHIHGACHSLDLARGHVGDVHGTWPHDHDDGGTHGIDSQGLYVYCALMMVDLVP